MSVDSGSEGRGSEFGVSPDVAAGASPTPSSASQKGASDIMQLEGYIREYNSGLKDSGFSNIINNLDKGNIDLSKPIPNLHRIVKPGSGNTLLHEAARWGGDKAFDKLVKEPGLINQVNKANETPLDLAAKEGEAKYIPKLIEAGATISPKTLESIKQRAQEEASQAASPFARPGAEKPWAAILARKDIQEMIAKQASPVTPTSEQLAARKSIAVQAAAVGKTVIPPARPRSNAMQPPARPLAIAPERAPQRVPGAPSMPENSITKDSAKPSPEASSSKREPFVSTNEVLGGIALLMLGALFFPAGLIAAGAVIGGVVAAKVAKRVAPPVSRALSNGLKKSAQIVGKGIEKGVEKAIAKSVEKGVGLAIAIQRNRDGSINLPLKPATRPLSNSAQAPKRIYIANNNISPQATPAPGQSITAERAKITAAQGPRR